METLIVIKKAYLMSAQKVSQMEMSLVIKKVLLLVDQRVLQMGVR